GFTGWVPQVPGYWPITRPDKVYRTGKRECSIPYPWEGQEDESLEIPSSMSN
ncbi:MAG: hypothetical protein EZS28_045259, partial [Streblomastix strix]